MLYLRVCAFQNNKLLHCLFVCFVSRLERAVHNEVCCLWIPYRGWRQMGGGSQQQLSLTVFQLHGEYPI